MGTTHTVLLVDDEEPVRKAIRRVLKYEPYRVLDSGSPVEALEIVEKEPVSLVVSDHKMPGMSGSEFLRKVAMIRPEVVRIMLTGNANLEMAMQAINEGSIYRFLTKPWDNNELLLAVKLGLRAFDMEENNRRLIALVQKHRKVLARLENQQPGITGMKKKGDGLVVFEDDDLDAVVDDIEKEFGAWMVKPSEPR